MERQANDHLKLFTQGLKKTELISLYLNLKSLI